MEIWKPALGFEGFYEVSSLGRVRNRFGVVKKPRIDGGYHYYSLYISGKQNRVRLNRLVLSTFTNPEPALIARHKNGDPLDDRLDNLEWGTHKDNSQDKIKHGTLLFGEKHGNSRLTEKQVLTIIKRINSGEPSSKICLDYDVSRATIDFIKRGDTWRHLPR